MKRCPTCTRTFLDEQLRYCTDDGTPLVVQAQSSSFDEQGTVLTPTPPDTKDIKRPAPTQAFRPDEMPGGWPKPHAWAESPPPSVPALPPPWNAPSTPAQAWTPPSPPSQAWTPPPPPGGHYAVRKSQQNPVAIASLAVGIFSMTIGLCYLALGTGPVAVILGIVAMVQMKDNHSQSAGRGMAIAGIATGALAFVFVLFLILGIAFRAFG